MQAVSESLTTTAAYGVPFGLPGGDTDSDGDCDGTDVSQVYTWEEGTTYDVRGDIDLDGDVDSTDASTISSNYSGITLGRGELSDGDVWNRRGYAGYEFDGEIGCKYQVRHRIQSGELGRWQTRDPDEYVDGVSLYECLRSSPVDSTDPTGRNVLDPGDVGTAGTKKCEGLPCYKGHYDFDYLDFYDLRLSGSCGVYSSLPISAVVAYLGGYETLALVAIGDPSFQSYCFNTLVNECPTRPCPKGPHPFEVSSSGYLIKSGCFCSIDTPNWGRSACSDEFSFSIPVPLPFIKGCSIEGTVDFLFDCTSDEGTCRQKVSLLPFSQ